MPPTQARPHSPQVVLVFGEDDFTAKSRAKEIYQEWCNELGAMDCEIIEANAANASEALKAIARLRESLQTPPFFGSAKVIWLRDCNFLGGERVANVETVTAAVNDLAQELKDFNWSDNRGIRLLISAGAVDKRRTFFKAIEQIGMVESYPGLSVEDSKWENAAEELARQYLQARKKEMTKDALQELVSRVGPDARLLNNEIEKLALYVGDRKEIRLADLDAVCIRNKFARAFALADALGDRNLPQLFRCLDAEFWEMQFDREKSELGLLYGLVFKVRAMILVKEMLREGWIKPVKDFNRFRAQLARLPVDQLPADSRFNPLAAKPYVLFVALRQVHNYTADELVRAMDLLLQANLRLISSNLDERLVLQQTLVQIVGLPASATRS